MDNFIENAKDILAKHDCKFIKMISECRVLWENQIGIVRSDDISVLHHMTESSWDYWKQN